MKRHAITFFGGDDDVNHLPDNFYFYGVLVSPSNQNTGHYDVITVGVSGTAPNVSQVPNLIRAASEEEALQTALKELKNHPSHRGLHIYEGPLQKAKL